MVGIGRALYALGRCCLWPVVGCAARPPQASPQVARWRVDVAVAPIAGPGGETMALAPSGGVSGSHRVQDLTLRRDVPQAILPGLTMGPGLGPFPRPAGLDGYGLLLPGVCSDPCSAMRFDGDAHRLRSPLPPGAAAGVVANIDAASRITLHWTEASRAGHQETFDAQGHLLAGR